MALGIREQTVIIPLDDLKKAGPLINIASGILHNRQGKAILLGVVEMPGESTLSQGALLARKQRALMQTLSRVDEGTTLNVHTQVRVSHSLARGIQTAVEDEKGDLLLLDWGVKESQPPFGETIGELVRLSPCNLAVVKPGKKKQFGSILLPVRGGPHAELAMDLVLHLAERFDSVVTLLHIDIGGPPRRREREIKKFMETAARLANNPRVRCESVKAASVTRAILSEARKHDIVVLGAAARVAADDDHLFGSIADMVATRCNSTVIIVKTREPIDVSIFESPEEESIGRVVDNWFAENTFHSREFSKIDELVEAKQKQGLRISVGLPTLNEEATIGSIIKTIKTELMERKPLVDEIALIDGGSTDKTVEIATSLGVPVYFDKDILPEYGSFGGKGDALWKSLYVLEGDIIVWLDTDIRNFHPKFIYGLIGPLLFQERLKYVKGFYWRHPGVEATALTPAGAGRVSELAARPLINLFFPELSGLIHPLAGEYAGRRDVLEHVPFFTGYGVEFGLLVDIISCGGLQTIAQTDLDERIHRYRTLQSLSESAFAILQVAIKRLEERQQVSLLEAMNTTMNMIRHEEDHYYLQVKEIGDTERPPMDSIPEYRAKRHLSFLGEPKASPFRKID